MPHSIVRFRLRVCLFAFLGCAFGHSQTPVITSVSPNPLGIGQSVTISGTSFGASGTVTFSGVSASTTSWSATSIVATVPTITSSGNIVVTSGGHSSAGFAFSLNNGPVNYVYDSLGRLTEVVDVNGNAAEYTYDAVGNILSISRFTSTQVSIGQFSPQSGPVGTVVTISGTGFSATPSQNTVKFNGTTATVSTASNTQLQVPVPAGATTGSISVTSPNGTATSTTNFTVTSSNGMPSITSFSPGSGLSSTAVTLTGVNFDTVTANDKLRLNATPITVTTATSTSLATSVPAANSSGRFTLLTPAGTATSQDFYVPFASHVPADIGFSSRVAVGASQGVTLASGKIALVLFDGVEGQHVSVSITSSTFSSCTLYFIAPNNATLVTTSCSTGASDLSSTYLPQSGTYTIGIDPGTNSGSVTVSPTSDVLGTILIDGPLVAVATTIAGQDARLSFTAQPGGRIVVYARNVTNPGAILNLVSPTGTQASVGINNNPSGQTFFIDTQTLTAGGAYQLWVQHSGPYFGGETLQIVSVPADFGGTLAVPSAGSTGAATLVPAANSLVVGQNANLTFAGTAGQKLSFNLVGSTIGAGASVCYLTVYDPNNNSLAFAWCGAGNSGFVDTITLASTGTYTVRVDPQGTATGSVSVSINNDQDVTTPAISIGGAAVTSQTTVAGQDVRLSFTPTAAQPRIVVQITNVTAPFATLNLWNGTSTQASVALNNSPVGQVFFIDTQAVNAGQQYQLWVQHNAANIGKETMQIKTVPADLTHTSTVGGAAYVFSTQAGQNANITFTISTSKAITVHWTSGTYPTTLNCYVRVTGPSPSTNQVGFGNCNAATGTVSLGTIAAGTYNILVDPQAQSSGGMSLTVTNP